MAQLLENRCRRRQQHPTSRAEPPGAVLQHSQQPAHVLQPLLWKLLQLLDTRCCPSCPPTAGSAA